MGKIKGVQKPVHGNSLRAARRKQGLCPTCGEKHVGGDLPPACKGPVGYGKAAKAGK